MKWRSWVWLFSLSCFAGACAEAAPEQVASPAPATNEADPAALNVRTSVGEPISTEAAQALLARAEQQPHVHPVAADFDALLAQVAAADDAERPAEIRRYLMAVMQLPESERSTRVERLADLWERAE